SSLFSSPMTRPTCWQPSRRLRSSIPRPHCLRSSGTLSWPPKPSRLAGPLFCPRRPRVMLPSQAWASCPSSWLGSPWPRTPSLARPSTANTATRSTSVWVPLRCTSEATRCLATSARRAPEPSPECPCSTSTKSQAAQGGPA
ncbi:hypothetical protein E2I00_008944, partial [Balaenoptera physalus]